LTFWEQKRPDSGLRTRLATLAVLVLLAALFLFTITGDLLASEARKALGLTSVEEGHGVIGIKQVHDA
jgi:hypothetical protein